MVSGGHGGGETPVPIPNTAVKPASADGTWGEAPWESRTPPGFLYDKDLSHCDGSLSRSRQMECSVRHVHSLGDDRPQTLWFSSSQSPNRTAPEATGGPTDETSDFGPLGESGAPVPAKRRDTSVEASRRSRRTVAQATGIRSVCRFRNAHPAFGRELETSDFGPLGRFGTPVPAKCPNVWFSSSRSPDRTASKTADLGPLG